MEVGIQRIDPTQKIPAQGPRVSFNRDVHVKRIGNRKNESDSSSEQTTILLPPQNPKLTLRREVHSDLSEESILKEAALVLAQAGGVKCFAAGGSEGLRERLNEKARGLTKHTISPTPDKFHSLPTRKNKTSKPVTRSVSDASHKKSKKPSIFSIFSRKSEPNIEEIRSGNSKLVGNKRVSRSKSDVGKINGKKNSNEFEQVIESFTKPSQLSPIIENTQSEDYFAKVDAKNVLKLAKTEQSGNSILEKDVEDSNIDKVQFDSSTKAETRKLTGAQYREFGSLPRTKTKSSNSSQIFQQQSKSLEDMHCSQMPPEKLPLTKGITVDGLAKRLSMERFSPPPQLSSPGFSYTRPSNEQVVYAQVVCDDNQANQFIFSGSEKKSLGSKSNIRNISTDKYNHINSIHFENYIGQDSPGLHSKELSLGSHHCPYDPHAEINLSARSSDGSQRNLSEEDEGLGFETSKHIEDDVLVQPHKENSHSVFNDRRKALSEEPPIIPIVRKISHKDVRLNSTYRGRADGMDSRRHENSFESHKEFCDLSSRRAALESKIRNRIFGPIEREIINNPNQEFMEKTTEKDQHRQIASKGYDEEGQSDRFTSPNGDNYHKYHKPNSAEVIHKYSPERTHIDIISPVKETRSFKYVFRNTKSDIPERSGRQNLLDNLDGPYLKEINKQDFSSSRICPFETATIVAERSPVPFSICHEQFEPKSLDFQLSQRVRLSPVLDKQVDKFLDVSNRTKHKQARSFDKGDSGIENDFRKESLTRERIPKRRNWTVEDDIHACKIFLQKERRHIEELHQKRYDFIYRERSIDDGSHFDPRLDKYPKNITRKSLQKEIDRYSNPGQESGKSGTKKREKKKGSLQKVKELFSGNMKKKEDSIEALASTANKESGKVNDAFKSRYMVQEDEMRRRYNEYKPNISDATVTDIAMRRRLSTPKASPLLKRTSSEKSQKPSPLSLRDDSVMSKAEKSGWFKSIDRRSKKKQSDRFTPPAQAPGTFTIQDGFSTLQVKKSHRATLDSPTPLVPDKNLRFFGDTDLESAPSFSRAKSVPRYRPSVVSLKRNQKYSQSAYHLDRIMMPMHKPEPRSSSLQNLENGFDEPDNSRKHQYSRSPNLDDISESESELSKHHQNHRLYADRTSSSRNTRNMPYDDFIINNRPSLPQRRESSELTRIEFRRPPSGPPKPARTPDKRTTVPSLNRERDRFQDSSGTEGDTSLQSQRSVVYLHATTVGAIPQPYFLNSRRRALSREELSALKQKEKLQPMTRTVSRSVSMLAPWKPKKLHDGFEINYSQEPSQEGKKNHLTNKKNILVSSNSNKLKKTSIKTGSQQTKSNMQHKDDRSPSRPSSSLVSTSKSGMSSNKKLPTGYRQNTLSRRQIVK